MNLSPLAIQKFFDDNGRPLNGGLLFTYAAGTTTKIATYTDESGISLNTNPIVLDYRGECRVWLDPELTYKFVLAPRGDTDPPTNPIWSVDHIAGALTISTITQQFLGKIIYPRSTAESLAGVVPLLYIFPWGIPDRYGAVGDGSTDDTSAVQDAIDQANNGGAPLRGNPYKPSVYLCAPLSQITVADFVCENIHLKVKADSWSNIGDGSTHVNVLGTRPRFVNVTIDGNQSAFTSEPTGRLFQLLETVSQPYVENLTLKNSPAVGARLYCNNGEFIGFHFDDNANLGLELITASYLDFSDGSIDRNGCGFHQTFATNAFAAFGMAVRYQSHHITFTAVHAKQNGRDGLNVNQGSYAIKFAQCLAWMNDDGGFTLAADPGSGPGAGTSCYDIEYVDCESYNNWGSGIASYNPSHDVTVLRGRYYNNGRTAGMQAFTASLLNGIYFAAGSTSINVDAMCYDDRQLRPITAVSGTSPRTLTATGWVSGLATNYPRVALYNASMVFQGYGTISSESAGSVTITTTANNGVTLASITSGWYVTQRVQHNGLFVDNQVQTSSAYVDGFGFLPGPVNYTGFKVISGYLNSGQNILLPKYPLETAELIINPTFDVDILNWSFSTPGGGSAARHTGANKRSAGSLALTAGSSPAVGDGALITNALNAAQIAFVEFSMWALADQPGQAFINLFWTDGATFATGVNHPGGGWKKLTIGIFLAATATDIFPRVGVNTGTCYFDTGSLRVRMYPTDNNDYAPSSQYLPV